MNIIEYVKLNEVALTDFVSLLNKQKIREHLIDHPLFDIVNAKAWIEAKLQVDCSPGCKVRAILVNKHLAGWCGIQIQDGQYEIAVIIDDKYWGLGVKIFREMMIWAKNLGHKSIFIHFHHTRPEYRFLRKISKNVYESKLLGSKFTSYELAVE